MWENGRPVVIIIREKCALCGFRFNEYYTFEKSYQYNAMIEFDGINKAIRYGSPRFITDFLEYKEDFE